MIFLDIETLDFFADPAIARLPRPVQLLAMRWGLATTFDDAPGVWAQYWGPDVRLADAGMSPATIASDGEHALFGLWDALLGETVVGWNIFDFDLPLLTLHMAADYYASDPVSDLTRMHIIDLMALCKTASKPYGRERWYKLGDVAQANLGRGKDGNGQQAAEDLRSGEPARLAAAAAYCKSDVQLCVDLLALAQTSGLLLPARPERGEAGDLRLWLNERGELAECRREVKEVAISW